MNGQLEITKRVLWKLSVAKDRYTSGTIINSLVHNFSSFIKILVENYTKQSESLKSTLFQPTDL